VPICARMKTTSKVRDLDRARGYRKVRRNVSRTDPVPETVLQKRRAARDSPLQKRLDLGVVHKRRDAHQKATPGAHFSSFSDADRYRYTTARQTPDAIIRFSAATLIRGTYLNRLSCSPGG
jgi:hypothetical protein